MENKVVQILVDNDSWILPYAEQLLTALQSKGFAAVLIRDSNDIGTAFATLLLGCKYILPKALLSRSQHNLVVHESALPGGRGFAPMSWQILEGHNTIPVTLFEANEHVDAGEIWLQDHIILAGHELHSEWRELQGKKTVELCVRFFTEYNTLTKKAQQGKSSIYPARTPADSELNCEQTIAAQFDKLRIVDNDNYPAYFTFRGHRYRLRIEKI